MKKILVFLVIVIIIISIISYGYLKMKTNYEIAKRENYQFESYYNQEILGTEIATIINKIVDNNSKNEIGKDNKGKYIENNENSMKLDIKFIDDEKIHNMEEIYINGIDKFVKYYGDINFKCTKIDYHKNTNKIKYMLFEQISE